MSFLAKIRPVIDGGIERKNQTLLLLATLCMLSCSSSIASRERGFPIYAVAGDRVLVGTATTTGRQGKFEVRSIDRPVLLCKGDFLYQFRSEPVAKVRCLTGETGKVTFENDRPTQGKGTGTSSLGPVQMVFGYSLAKANRVLTFPGNSILIPSDNGYRLAPRKQTEGE